MTPSELLLAHDDFVRRLARSLLRDAHRAEDLAQETWLAVLRSPPRGLRSVRAWLTAVVKNLAARSVREQECAGRLEPRGARAESLPAVDEMLAREAQRRRLVESVVGLAEPYRETLILRFFDQLPPRAIARRLQVPVETVRTRVKRALALLRARLDAQHGGDATQWLGGLAMLWPLRPGATAAAALLTTFSGVLFMSAKMKLVAALATLAMLLAGWWSLGGFALGGAPGQPGDHPAPVAAPALPRTKMDTSTAPEVAASAASQRVELSVMPGSLRVTVVYESDGSRAAGAWVKVIRFDPKDDWFLERKDLQAGADGTFTVEGEAPGRLLLHAYQGGTAHTEVHGGRVVAATVTIPAGVAVSGEVVDAEGQPVNGAGIWLGQWPEGRVVTRTGVDGTFALRSVNSGTLLCANADGHAPSLSQYVEGKPGRAAKVRLVLERPVALTGTVVDAEGVPVRGARVLVGHERGAQFTSHPAITPPPHLLTTDAEGRFRAEGLRQRDAQPIAVRASGLAPWQGTWSPELPAPLRVQLVRAVTLVGTVRDERGQPVRGARVTVGSFRAFDSARTTTGEDGTFRLLDLPVTPFTVSADMGRTLAASAELRGEPDSELRWDPVLTSGRTITGVVVDEARSPLRGWRAAAHRLVEGNPYAAAQAHTDSAGRFSLPHLTDENHRLTVFEPGEGQQFPVVTVGSVAVGQAGVRIVVPALARATASIEGVVLGADGLGCPGASLAVRRQDSDGILTLEVERGTGRFRTGPIPPGLYSVAIGAGKDLPELNLPPYQLEAGKTWDTGPLRIDRPGSAVIELVTPDGKPPAGVRMRFTHESGTTATRSFEAAPFRSPPLLPGSWRMQILGNPLVADETAFTIRSGEETRLVVRLRQGVRRLLHVAWDGTTPRRVRVVVRDGAGRTWIDFATKPNEPSPLVVGPTLDLGTYDVQATTDDGRKASATFAIQDVAAAREPIELKLQ